MKTAPLNLERQPPVALEMEQAALGSVFRNADTLDTLLAMLRRDDFSADAHRRIYDVLHALHRADRPTDELTVCEELERRGELERAGDRAYVSNLREHTATPSHCDYYCAQVAEKSGLRKLITSCGEVSAAAYDGQPLADLCTLLARVTDLAAEQRGLGEPATSLELSKDAFRRIFETENTEGVPTGLIGLQQATHGWQPTEQITLAGRPGMGKTAAALFFARAAALRGHPVLFFSLEMSKEQLTDRNIAGLGDLNSWRLRKPHLLSNDERTLIVRTLGRLEDLPLSVEDKSDLSLLEIRAIARRWKRKNPGLGLVVIDYLQLVRWPSGFENENNALEYNANDCKRLAKELRCPVLLLSQLNRTPARRDNKRPQLQELRGSGGIEQAADIVVFIHREDYYRTQEEGGATPLSAPSWPQETEFIIAKNRNGDGGTVWCNYDGRTSTFSELDRHHDDADAPPERRAYAD